MPPIIIIIIVFVVVVVIIMIVVVVFVLWLIRKTLFEFVKQILECSSITKYFYSESSKEYKVHNIRTLSD